VLLYTCPAWLSLLHRLDGFHSARSRGTHGAPEAALRGSEAVLSWEVGTVAAVTRSAPEAALRGPGATLSRDVGTGATVARGAPRAALCREAGAAPEATPCRSIVGCFW
jgi:hypothetical protein